MDKVVPADAGQRPRVTPWYLQLWFLVLVAMAGGIALGQLYPEIGARMEPLGNAFIKAVRVLIAPIIFCTVVHGISSMARMAKVGRVALKALIYFEVLTTVALVIGLLAVNLFQPGGGMNVDLSHVDTWSVAPYLEQTHSRTTAQFLLDIIPHTFVGALSEGNVLQVLYVSVLCGFRIELDGPNRQAADRSDQNGLADVLSHRRHRDVGGADRRIRRHGVHRRQIRHRFVGLFGQAAGEFLFHLPLLHHCRAVADLPLVRLQLAKIPPLYPGRIIDRDRERPRRRKQCCRA